MIRSGTSYARSFAALVQILAREVKALREQLRVREQQRATLEGQLAAAQEANQPAARQAQGAVATDFEQTGQADSETPAGPSAAASEAASSQAAIKTDASGSAAAGAEAVATASTSYRHLLQEVAALRQRLHDSSIEVVAGTCL